MTMATIGECLEFRGSGFKGTAIRDFGVEGFRVL